MANPTATERRPLIISGDPQTSSRLVELATAAGTTPWQVAEVAAAEHYWSLASVIVIGDDVAESFGTRRLTKRDNVILLAGDDHSAEESWRMAVAIGADQVASLPAASDWIIARMAPPTTGRLDAPVVAIAGARGGSGTSTLAVATALRAAHAGKDTLLVDLDPCGGGLDLVLGWEQHSGLRWPELIAMPTAFDPRRLKSSLPSEGRLSLLSHTRIGRPAVEPDRLAGILAAARQNHDLIVLDLPRPGIQQVPRLTGTNLLTVVVPGEIRAVAAARHVIAGYAQLADRACLITRKPSPGRLSDEQIAHVVSAPVIASWNTDPKLAGAMEAVRFAGRIRRGELATVTNAVLAAAASSDREPVATS